MASRPNVLVITTDQQRTDSLSCYGSTFTATPNLDRLGAEGVILERAYCANPVCTPARASIFSGLQMSRHGAWNVGMKVPTDVPFLSNRLRDLGYRTHYVGKAHFEPFQGESMENLGRIYTEPFPYYGFDAAELAMGHTVYGFGGHYGHWVRQQISEAELDAVRDRSVMLAERAWGGEGYDWALPTALHNSVWTADRALVFLEAQTSAQPSAQPFFLALGFQDPHHPHYVPTDFPERVSPASVPLPDYEEGELADKPAFFAAQREGRIRDSGVLGSFVNPARPEEGPCHLSGQGHGGYVDVPQDAARVGRAYYHTMVRLIDREVGRILAGLESMGLAENTFVVFVTDHGELLGDHGIWMKGPFLYEQLVRIPMLMRWPAGFDGGQRCDGLASQVDIVPTVLAALGLTAPELDGVSLLPVLRGATDAARDDVLVECVDAVDGLRLKTVVTQRWKLTWYADREFGELYDLEADPREKVNLWHDRRYADERVRLMGLILAHLEQLERHGSHPRQERFAYA